jgi:uncharacterized protein YbjT (DUF2867 family)/membrane protease YdiL (CAAX protease family)
MTTIAVIGGTGFLGRHVVARLQSAGLTVRALSRRNGFDARNANPELLRGVDAVVNLAGIKREEGGQTFQAVHVDLVHALVAAMKSAGVRRLIHSSVVVARPAQDLPYHDTKWKGEEVVRSSGLEYTILRPGVIYGEGDDMLSHLSLMIRTSPVFPIVGRGLAPMRPVDARDVAEAVLRALRVPCSGKTYDVVGPDPLKLRDVVRTVARALKLPLLICPTPIALMRLPVLIMERVMAKPLSTRAQLAMLAEGLDGNPEPARTDLSLTTSPFTVTRIRPMLPNFTREVSGRSFGSLLALAIVAMAIALGAGGDRWMGMTVAMGILLIGSLTLPAARNRLKPSVSRIVGGIAAGALLFLLTLPAVALLFRIQPSWEAFARSLYAWRSGHSPLFIAATLPMIVLAEEVLWRGVVVRFLVERWGTLLGVLAAALIYSAAHWAALNPVLLIAAVGCGLYWGLLYSATDDLITPFVAHLTWDVLLLFAFPVVH